MEQMTSMQRVMTAFGFKEPDRVPFILPVTLHGAKELGLSIQEYLSKAEYVVEGQIRMLERYRHDAVLAFFYGAIEVDAWGGEVIFIEDGPPNSGRPLIQEIEDIERFARPRIEESARLLEVLRATRMLKEHVGDRVPVIGVVISPFSLPVMQMGFDRYLELMYERPELFEHLMQVNEAFCVQWANAQFGEGATAVIYFDPVSSPTIIPRAMYLETGFQVARRTLAQFKGPAITGFASGRCLPILDDVAQTGTIAVGVSVLEDLAKLKAASRGRLALVGNLNAIEMRRWTLQQAEARVKEAIAKAGQGGGFVLSDNHGEIPWQVSEDVLLAISEAVHEWGRYPLDWVSDGA